MLLITLRKMRKNLWMTICLFLGFAMAIATVSSVPMFSKAAPYKQLMRDIRDVLKNDGTYPGQNSVEFVLDPTKGKLSPAYSALQKKVSELFDNRVGLPVIESASSIIVKQLAAPERSPQKLDICGYKEFDKLAVPAGGRMFGQSPEKDTYEAVITLQDMYKHKLAIGDVCKGQITVAGYKYIPINVKIVGVVAARDPKDNHLYKGNPFTRSTGTLYMDYSQLKELFVDSGKSLNSVNVRWDYALDYKKITTNNVHGIAQAYGDWEAYSPQSLTSPLVPLLMNFEKSQKPLLFTMFVLCLPVLVIIFLFIFMMSKLLVEYDRNEIAVISSRGGSRLQIFTGYLIQGSVIGVASMISGLLLGLFMSRLLSSTSSFMEFGNLSPLDTSIDGPSVLYSLIAVAAYLATMLTTVTVLSKTSIVQHKQNRITIGIKTWFWIKGVSSLLLLGLSGYWLYSYSSLLKNVRADNVYSFDSPVDPLLVLNSILFMMGSALLLATLIPFLIRLLFRLGKKFWPPHAYMAFVQVGRSRDLKELFMLFLILTMSVGVFNSNAARTINRNAEENIRYSTGADIVLQEHWDSFIPDQPTTQDIMAAAFGDPRASYKIAQYDAKVKNGTLEIIYTEPDFGRYSRTEGLRNAARVLIKNNAALQVSDKDEVDGVKLMGIDIREFAETAWLKKDLMHASWSGYLNDLASPAGSVLLSGNFEKKYGLKVGDTILLRLNKLTELEVVVKGFVDYWPGFDPGMAEDPGASSKAAADAETSSKPGSDKSQSDTGSTIGKNYLVVANLQFLQTMSAPSPYQVWIKKDPGVSAVEMVRNLKAQGIQSFDSYQDAGELLSAKKSEPLIQGTNGSLTFSFIIVMIVSFGGFIIYWILSVKSREFIFGVLRSMGIQYRKILSMLALEHIMTSFLAVISGIAAGHFASMIFIPMFRMNYNSGAHILPFDIVSQRSDYLRLYFVICIMFITAFIVLGYIIRRIKVAQALKMGED